MPKVPYATLPQDEQAEVEDSIIATLRAHGASPALRDDRKVAEDVLYLILRRFRPELFADYTRKY